MQQGTQVRQTLLQVRLWRTNFVKRNVAAGAQCRRAPFASKRNYLKTGIHETPDDLWSGHGFGEAYENRGL